MPVTIFPSPDVVGKNADVFVQTAQELFKATSRAWCLEALTDDIETNKIIGVDSRQILQSGFPGLNGTSLVIPYGNGFVNGMIRAFQQDLHIVLRPETIWLAILIQFSMFVNAHSEKLRSYFVEHKDKRTLELDITPFSVWQIGMGPLSQRMAGLIQDTILDKTLREWIIPDFSTTTDHDKSVASIVMMATMQKYFDYIIKMGCGFPSVTLQGERSDWEEILRRVQELPKFGDEPSQWSRLLVPVIQHMIASFDNPGSQETKDFWMRAYHSAGADGSGNVETMSGWLTAFCFWNADGARVQQYSDKQLSYEWQWPSVEERRRLTLDGIEFPLISPDDISVGVVSVPVIINDMQTGTKHKTTIVAGSVGACVDESQTKVEPVSGWWLLEDSAEPLLDENRLQDVVS